MQNSLRVIAEPRRRDILRLVWSRERSAGEIASCFEVSRPAISQHLQVLKHAGLVSERREGTRRLYRARPEGVAELRAFFEGLWDDSLDRLKTAAEHSAKERDDASHGD